MTWQSDLLKAMSMSLWPVLTQEASSSMMVITRKIQDKARGISLNKLSQLKVHHTCIIKTVKLETGAAVSDVAGLAAKHLEEL